MGVLGPPKLGAKNHIKKKTRKQNFHGIVPGFFFFGGGDFVYVLFLPVRNDPRKTHKQYFATQSRDNPAHLFMFMCCLFP